jgi:Mg-chelatase subunit ChlD
MRRARLLLGVVVAAGLLAAGPAMSAFARPAAGCQLAQTARTYGVTGGSAQWGHEVDVTVHVAILCEAGATPPTELVITETLSAEAPWVDGFGTPPDQVADRSLTWRFANPAVAPALIEVTYRVYATPDPARLAGDKPVPVSWPIKLELTVDGATTTATPELAPLLVRAPDSATCALARSREVSPETVLAGEPFTVTLRLTLNRCPAFAQRTRLVVLLQPPGSAEEATRQELAVQALLTTLAPENAAAGLVINAAAGPVVVRPTADYALVLDAVRAAPVEPAGADAAAGLGAALGLLPAWAFHHSVVLYLTTGRAPAAEKVALQQQLGAARDAGVELVPVCVGGGCDAGLSVAYSLADWPTVRRRLTGGLLEAHRGPPLVVNGLEVEDRLLRFVHVEAGSAVPPAEVLGGNGFFWRHVPASAGQEVVLRYRARVDIWGRLPLGAGGSAVVLYEALRHRFDLPRGSVHVVRKSSGETKPCQPEVAKTADPARLPLGDSVEVKLSFGAVCPGEVNPVDIVLVQDVSGSMSGGPLADAKAALLGFLNTVDSEGMRVGLVAFDHEIALRLAPSADLAPVRAAVAALQAGGGTDIALGLRDARNLLRGRRPEATPVVVLMTDGYNNAGPDPVLEESLDLRTDGILVVAVCFGGRCDPSLPDAATDESYYYSVLTGDELLVLFAELGAQLRQARLASLRIVDRLPANMRYVPGSAVPAPVFVTADSLVWDLVDPPAGGVAVRYRAEPLLLGLQPTNASATASYVDDRGRRGEAPFPVPQVETYIPGPEGPCNPSLAKVAAPARLNLGETATVRLTLAMACPKRQAALDVVLVLDHSASMGFLDRLVNVKRAAGVFLDGLDPAVTRVGLVSFGTDVTGRIGLTDQFGQVRGAVEALRPAGETGIGQALNAAREELGRRRPEALPVAVLLTDGGNTAGPGPMLAAAGRLKDDGVRVVTVCAGECDKELAAVASEPGYAFSVADSAALVALFQNLAADLSGTRPHDLVVTDAFPAAIEVEAGSLSPAPDQLSADEAIWRLSDLPRQGITLTYRVRPLVAGLVPANRFARLDYRWGAEGVGRAFFPVPLLEVVDPNAPTPTHTPGPLTPSATPSGPLPTTPPSTGTPPTATPTPSPGATSPTPGGPPSLTPTPTLGYRIHLPYCEQSR